MIRKNDDTLADSDTTFVPKRSLRNGVEAIPKYAKREHHIDQYIGEGEQTFRWLVLAARERLVALYNFNKGSFATRGHGWYPWRVYT